jgi:hypothetical protein
MLRTAFEGHMAIGDLYEHRTLLLRLVAAGLATEMGTLCFSDFTAH